MFLIIILTFKVSFNVFSLFIPNLDEKKLSDTSNDQLGFVHSSSSSKEEFIMCKEEQNVSVAGPSTILFETSTSLSQYHQGVFAYAK